MPLKRGRSRDTISSNIGELVRSFKRTGRIGSSMPKTLAKARRMATAIAFAQSRRGRR